MFLYFVPGFTNNQWQEAVAHADIAYAFDNSPSRSLNEAGPFTDKPQGVLLANHTSKKTVGYYEDQQTWRQFERFSVGYWNDAKPTPSELEREKQLPGEDLKINDQIWHVPRAIMFSEANDSGITYDTKLSRYIDCDAEGRSRYGDVEAHLQPLMDIALEYWEILRGSSDMLLGELHAMPAKSLQFNYRVSVRELAILQVLTDVSVAEILDIVCDVAGYRELLKKSFPPDELSTTLGEPEETQPTDQPLQTSP